MRTRTSVLAAIAILALLVAGLGWHARCSRPLGEPLHGDEPDYLFASWNLLHHATLAYTALASEPPAPSAYREPGYPAFLALVFGLSGSLDGITADQVATLDPTLRPALAPVRLAQHLLLFIASLASAGAAWRLTGSRIAAAAAALLVAGSPALLGHADRLASEALAAPLLALFALALLELARTPTLRRGVTAGLLLAALALTSAAFAYFVPVALAFLTWQAWHEPARRRALARGAAALFATSVLPIGAWMLRNQLACGHAVVSESRMVLAIRAELDRDLDRNEARAAFLDWTPSVWTHDLLARVAPDARLVSIRWRDDRHYFARAMARRRALLAELRDPVAADLRLRREAASWILRHPLRHLAATPLVAWRGLFAEQNSPWARALNPALALNLLLAAAFAVLTVRTLRRGDLVLLAFLLPALFLAAFHALATEGLPRFQQPALPIWWTAAVLASTEFVTRAQILRYRSG